MEYKAIQKTESLRCANGVKAYRILDIQGKDLIFQLWFNDESSRGSIKVSFPKEYQIGEYVDLQVIRTSKMSYQVTLIGRTPATFVPADGRNMVV